MMHQKIENNIYLNIYFIKIYLSTPTMEKTLISKADALIKNAKKEISPRFKLFDFYKDQEQKYENAAIMFTDAANLFKIEKQWILAGDAFVDAAHCYIKRNSRYEASGKYIDAANCYKKVDNLLCIKSFDAAIELLATIGKFTTAAKHLGTVAGIYENDIFDLEKSIEYFEKAADYFKCEESNPNVIKCRLTSARLFAQTEKYERAIQVYDECAAEMIDDPILKFSVNDICMKSILCRMCIGDIIGAKIALERCETQFCGFFNSRSYNFLKKIIGAAEENNIDHFMDYVTDYDYISVLDIWMTTILLRIKKQIFNGTIEL